MVKFGKNGSNATTAAVKIARAFTGRRYVCIPKQHPFFSFDDWFIGTTAVIRGIPEGAASSTLVFEYGDIDSLERLFSNYPNQIAAVMLEPATTLIPCLKTCHEVLTHEQSCLNCPNKARNFLHQVQELCRRYESLFILDEMITGFRWHLQGAQTYFGVTPDLTTFGKGMANGFSVAAVGGRRDVMEVGNIKTPGMERTFLLSTTHGGEMSALGAFIETVNVYRQEDVCRHLWQYGQQLKDGLMAIALQNGIQDYFKLDGPAISMNYEARDADGKLSPAFRTLFSQEMIRHGVLMPWISVSLAHGAFELEITLAAADKALKVYSKALVEGVENYLQGPVIQPVFRKHN
jgi:glutamate-1-semialdehyde 2,1-aminomutase